MAKKKKKDKNAAKKWVGNIKSETLMQCKLSYGEISDNGIVDKTTTWETQNWQPENLVKVN